MTDGPADPRIRLTAAILAGLILGTVALAAPVQAERFEEDTLRDQLAGLRARVDDAVDRYLDAHANYTSATTEANRSEAREAMAAAGRDVGDTFIRFERGHGNASSLNAFMQERMPSGFYPSFERQIVLLRSMMTQAAEGEPAPPGEVQAQQNLVTNALDRTGSCMPEGCRGALVGVAAQSFVILLREGFEAILIVGAIVAYLYKSNRGDRVPQVYGGVGLAILASLGLWFVLGSVFDAARPGSTLNTVLEGTSMLLAAAVLFYVSYWLLSKAESRRWRDYIDGKVEDSLAQDRTWVLGLVGFLAVFREGVETALFLQALSTRTGGATLEIGLGLGVAALVLVFVYYAVHVIGVKVPLRAFFVGTSALLYVLALRFVGLGVFEFQEGGLIPVTPMAGVVAFLQSNGALAFLLQDVLGFVPTAEVMAAQALLVVALIAGGAWTVTRARIAEPARG